MNGPSWSTWLVGGILSGAFAWGLATTPAFGQAKPTGADLFLTRTCIACHGKDAKTPLLPEYPKLAGQNKAYLLRQMKDIKSGARANGNSDAMRGVMPLVNEQEMELIAEYLSTLK
ncbi:MAG: c-type cytochrome [Candidatus Lambdaproteobacteria bacterium]|nr:c-type cytochrome [Candidatus Lambdaproteobacteria bacterium]